MPTSNVSRRVIAVGSGKGGVGKSLVAVNLGVTLARLGISTTLVDGDLGASNLHTLLGLRKASPSLLDFIDHRVVSLAETMSSTDIPGLSLVRGVSATPGAANINYAQKQRLIRHLRTFPSEVVIVDVGAGVSFNMLDLFDAADARLVVTTPQLTALQNAYGFLKSAVFRELEKKANQIGCPPALAALLKGTETARVPQVLADVQRDQPAVAEALVEVLANFGGCLLGNNLFADSEQGAIAALARMTKDFLGIDMPVVGNLRASRAIHDSVNAAVPFAVRGGPPEALVALQRLADWLLHERPTARVEHLDDSHCFPVHWPGVLQQGQTALSATVSGVWLGGLNAISDRPFVTGERWTLTVPAVAGAREFTLRSQRPGHPGPAAFEFLDPPQTLRGLLATAEAEQSLQA